MFSYVNIIVKLYYSLHFFIIFVNLTQNVVYKKKKIQICISETTSDTQFSESSKYFIFSSFK